jgi:hypothetical protein
LYVFSGSIADTPRHEMIGWMNRAVLRRDEAAGLLLVRLVLDVVVVIRHADDHVVVVDEARARGAEQVDSGLVRIDVGVGARRAGVERVVHAIATVVAGHEHLVDRDGRTVVHGDVELLDEAAVHEGGQVDVTVEVGARGASRLQRARVETERRRAVDRHVARQCQGGTGERHRAELAAATASMGLNFKVLLLERCGSSLPP